MPFGIPNLPCGLPMLNFLLLTSNVFLSSIIFPVSVEIAASFKDSRLEVASIAMHNYLVRHVYSISLITINLLTF